MSKLVLITTPLTQDVAAFVGRLQEKGSAVIRVDSPEVFRQAVRMEARRRRLRVRTGIADQDPNIVWACDPTWNLSDKEYARGNRRAANQFAALLRGAPSSAGDE
jgi:hypothetical protein